MGPGLGREQTMLSALSLSSQSNIHQALEEHSPEHLLDALKMQAGILAGLLFLVVFKIDNLLKGVS